MRLAGIIISVVFSASAWADVQMQTRTESGIAIELMGKKPVRIAQPIELEGAYGRKATLGVDLQLDNEGCDTVGLIVEQFTDGDALVAYCRVDSGPRITYMANLVPPTCKEGVLAKGTKNHFVCRVHAANCRYDYNPYTWQELAVEADDNNHGCIRLI